MKTYLKSKFYLFYKILISLVDYAKYKNYLKTDSESIVLVINAYIGKHSFFKNGMFIKEI